MIRFKAYPAEISKAVDLVAKKGLPRDADEVDVLFERLRVLLQLAKSQRAAEREVVQALRDGPDAQTFDAISERTGLSLTAVQTRYAERATVTRDSEIGVTYSEAHKQTGIYPQTIRRYVRANPPGTVSWYVVTEKGVRITDLSELARHALTIANSRPGRRINLRPPFDALSGPK